MHRETQGGTAANQVDQKVSCGAFVLIWWFRESNATVSYLLVLVRISFSTGKHRETQGNTSLGQAYTKASLGGPREAKTI